MEKTSPNLGLFNLKVPPLETNNSEELEASISGDYSSLYIAAKHNHKEMVEYLLLQGDDNAYDSSGVMALMIALKEGNIDIAKLLLSHERLMESDNDDKNVFHHAFDSWKPEEATEILVEFIFLEFRRIIRDAYLNFITSNKPVAVRKTQFLQ